jgi:hypothetical protein
MSHVKAKNAISPLAVKNDDTAIGLCINCGHRVTLCGIPFTADVQCANCLVINHFRN